MNKNISLSNNSAPATNDSAIHTPSIHLLLDFGGVASKLLTDLNAIEGAIRAAAHACGATILGVHLHQFNEVGEVQAGVTGVAILAESHISIHTWPEINYAAIDVFMCGVCDANLAIPVFEAYFQPNSCKITTIARGIK